MNFLNTRKRLTIQELNAIVDKFDVMFKSSSRRSRVWAAFKATAQSKQVQRFRESLSETKATLTLAMIHQWLVLIC
jgi:head-tail adaptor